MNRPNTRSLALLLVAWLLGSPHVARAAESYDNCTGFITSLPAVISTPGTWCLKKDLATAMSSGNAVEIQTDDVVIDCNNFKLGGLAAGLGTSTSGIYSNNRARITVRHCNIRGFFYGLLLTGNGSDQLAEDNRFDNNTYVAVAVSGDGSIVRRNRVFDTGGSTLQANVYGISVDTIWAAGSTDVIDNTVVAAKSGTDGSAFGIQTVSLDTASVSGNRVRSLLANGAGIVRAISSFSTVSHLSMRDNDITGDGSAGSIGLYCQGSGDRSKDNVIGGFSTGISGCNDDNGNDVTP